jgi:hypothetical protein
VKRQFNPPKPKPFRLSGKANARLNNYLAQVRKGIVSVCELHAHDSRPSLKQGDFEELYIDKILAQTVTAVSVSIRAMTEGLTAQREAEAQALKAAENNTVINPQGDNKKEED